MAIIPQPGANYINISNEFNKRLEEIKKNEKSDIEMNVLVDTTRNVRRSLEEVEGNAHDFISACNTGNLFLF